MLARLGLHAAPIDPADRGDPGRRLEGADFDRGNPDACSTPSTRAPPTRCRRPPEPRSRRSSPDLLWIDHQSRPARPRRRCRLGDALWSTTCPIPTPWPAPGIPSLRPGLRTALTAPWAEPRRRHRSRSSSSPTARPFASQCSSRPASACRPSIATKTSTSPPPLLIEFSAEPFEYPREWAAEHSPRRAGALGAARRRARVAGGGGAPDRPRLRLDRLPGRRRLIRCRARGACRQPLPGRRHARPTTRPTSDPASNARVERFLPHGPILRRAAAVISHGGMGTTQKSLAAGVPVCVVPFMRDQFEVARRVEHCGAGTMPPFERLRAERLRAAVEAAIALSPWRRARPRRLRRGRWRRGRRRRARGC